MLLERLKNPEIRQQILYSIFHEVDEFESAIYSAGFDGQSCIVGASKTPEYVNKTIGRIAREEGKEPIDALCDVLLADNASMQGVLLRPVRLRSAADHGRSPECSWVPTGRATPTARWTMNRPAAAIPEAPHPPSAVWNWFVTSACGRWKIR